MELQAIFFSNFGSFNDYSTLQIYSMYFLHSIVKIFGMGQKVSSCLADQKFEPFLLILTL